ncbi:MAG TPA: histidine kinase, partial [Patescibacteria group bacterium]|nr:histidine kinase [Patescibacteria group bacterium]
MRVIRWVKLKYKNTTLSSKLIIAMSIAFFILFSLVISFNQYRTIKIITANQSTLSAETLNIKQQNFITYLNQLESYSLMLRNDRTFMQIISLNNIQDYRDMLYMKNVFSNMFYSRKDISELKLYLTNNGTYFSISKKHANMRSHLSPDLAELQEFVEASKWPNFKYVMPSKDDEQSFLKLYRTIINIETQKPLAYIEITMDKSFIEDLANKNSQSQDIFCLLDNNKNLYYTNNPNVIQPETLAEILTAKIKGDSGQASGNFITTLNDVEYLFIYSVDNANGWLLLNMTPTSIVNKTAVETRNITIFMIIIAMIIAMAAIYMLITTLLKPLKTLAAQMEKAGSGDFGAIINIDSSAEIKHLQTKFNSMLLEIDELIEKNYISELNEKTARLKALEAQINPHFLYNTLQMISTQALVSNQKDISNMVLALSSILRYSITDNDIVPLSSEIKHVKAYLTLQQARFDERLSYSLDVENNIEDLLLPKISIMSLVENSIKHGMETTLDKIEINVNVVLRQGFLVITVKDSGIGMGSERLEHVIKQISDEGEQSQSIGLSNLAGRLRILYGNSAALEIESSEDTGTTVKMRIPVNENMM